MTESSNTKPSSVNSKSYLKVSIVLFIIGIISLTFIEPSIPKVIEYAEGTKDCFANQHKLENIIKEISKTKRIGNILPGRDFELFELYLVKQRYLRDFLIIPSKDCSYGFVIVNGKGTVFFVNAMVQQNQKKTNQSFQNMIRVKKNHFLENLMNIEE